MNLRMGFATNSSSSHSIVIVPPGTLRDAEIDGEFGWNPFTAALTESKLRWARACFKNALEQVLGDGGATLFGRLFPDSDLGDYVDHQSCLTIPCSYGTTLPSFEFLDDLEAFLSRPEVVILGGNDNDGAHPLEGKYPEAAPWYDRFGTTDGQAWTTDGQAKEKVCRREAPGQWTTFDKRTGTRVTLSFTDNQEVVYKKPLLADVKITDYCPFGCSFCYQGSTESGKPAPLEDLTRVAGALENAECFEVAIGGGEPTLHPDFEEVVDRFRQKMVVNFTTRSLKWLASNGWWREKCGSVGYSYDPKAGLHKFFAVPGKLVLHVIPGLLREWELESILGHFANSHDEEKSVLFLGWKTTGRAGEKAPTDGERTLPTLLAKQTTLPKVSIDTCLAGKWEAEGLLGGLPKWLYETKDGSSSFYVDAVARTSAPSSYGKEKWPWLEKRVYERDGWGIKIPQGGHI